MKKSRNAQNTGSSTKSEPSEAAKKERDLQRTVRRERTVLCGVFLSGGLSKGEIPLRELELLVNTAGALVVGRIKQNLRKINGKFYMGKGKVHELKDIVEETEADVVVFDNDLSPSQSQNIEKVVGVKVVDRTELILDIFASRAITHLAKIQVALAMHQYRLPRLKQLWSHLERQRGGLGLRSGPGEQQIETDRRIIRNRIREYKKELSAAVRHKKMLAENRSDDHFTVSLLGYTNAGKTTLMNALTGSALYADDRLFATLDTRSRLYRLKDGKSVMLSDTVGFIQRLPHHLVASFQATLQEALGADLLLHMIDLSSPLFELHIATVEKVLDELGAMDKPRLMVFNKLDAVEDDFVIETFRRRFPGAVFVSAYRKEGLEDLEVAVVEYLRRNSKPIKLSLPLEDGRALAFIAQNGFDEVREYAGKRVIVSVRIDEGHLNRLFKIAHGIRILTEPGGVKRERW